MKENYKKLTIDELYNLKRLMLINILEDSYGFEIDRFAFHTKYKVWPKQEVTTPQVIVGTTQTYENYATSSMMKNP